MMSLTADSEQLTAYAVAFFRQSELPEALSWATALSPVNQRLFAVELADALKEATITGDSEGLVRLLTDWQATAELDASPEVAAELERPKSRLPLGHFLNS